jgi:hypothetical protein
MRGTLVERFWAKVLRTDDANGCWLWQGATRTGYGMIRDKTRSWSPFAHRLSYEFAHGPIPDGLVVCHRCDNPLCVRPTHLFLGTHADNFRDMVNKRRQSGHLPPRYVGADHPIAKLSDEAVREIRRRYADGEPKHRIANSFNVSDTTISHIVKRLTWRHVT